MLEVSQNGVSNYYCKANPAFTGKERKTAKVIDEINRNARFSTMSKGEVRETILRDSVKDFLKVFKNCLKKGFKK